MSDDLQLLRDPDHVRAALSPIRRQLLEQLREPGSASSLATALNTSRQRLNYHLKALEDAGLVALVEERRRRGFTERVLVAKADAFLVDPTLMGASPREPQHAQDRYAANHLISTAARLVRDVGRMQAAADKEASRLLTFTIEAQVALARPADVEQYAEALAQAVAEITERFNSTAPQARPYRVMVGGSPAPATSPAARRSS